jgi:hypothetical protein
MEMTEDEIVKKYQANPKPGTITLIADLNGVRDYEIKRILGKAGVLPLKKPGRPKKEPEATLEKIDEIESSQNEIKTKQNEPLNPKILEAIHKNDSLPEAKPLQSIIVEPIKEYMVPEVVKEVINEELDRISARMIEICDEADELNARRNKLKAFLKGE